MFFGWIHIQRERLGPERQHFGSKMSRDNGLHAIQELTS
jgi:hypothetical protein